ncbi:bifunctional adenosylcobinamide kinase/adenosylcobinamide-phosphate guanylyltransferase [Ectobacillus panaciterrae]|uniref:bifunctional adenosylcobinamide kinase/adenosylcobinamide-phosphate guanylyltransferase n=1 Tax=Ectobacillus panaciterrae TaxID=363872 RepID=UPI0003FDB325|nr:bifunctional adenosylcobinamide kinase/adenosylcobinamide-phosphate guanylyltransferase [Ectobacillus panaciterrae]
MATDTSLIFITGGVRSGKSTYAERIAACLAERTDGNLHYIATGYASDQEMKSRIACHQKQRAESPRPWRTWEQSVHIHKLAPYYGSDDIVLLDCITTLVSNELFSSEERWKDKDGQRAVKQAVLEGISEIRKRSKVLIVVSNEVLHEPIHHNELVVVYGKLIGQLHQHLVKECTQAYLVEAGIPILMKGEPI